MWTITANLPTTFSPTLSRLIRLHRSLGQRRCDPVQAHRRTRGEVLQVLAGADSGRFHHVPKRRKAR
jgi:hypothetical protein